VLQSSGGTAIFKQGTDGVHERHAGRAEFTDTMPRYLLQQFFPTRQERDENAAAIIAAAAAAHIAVSFETVDELDGTMMLEREPVGKNADGGFLALREAANGQQEKILLGLKAGGAGDNVAFADKFADAIAKLREGLIFGGGDLLRHGYSISQYDTYCQELSTVLLQGMKRT